MITIIGEGSLAQAARLNAHQNKISAVVVSASSVRASCKIITTEKVQCPLCGKIVTGTHHCKAKAFK